MVERKLDDFKIVIKKRTGSNPIEIQNFIAESLKCIRNFRTRFFFRTHFIFFLTRLHRVKFRINVYNADDFNLTIFKSVYL